MNNVRTITAAGIATLALAGGAALTSGAANADDRSGGDKLARPAKTVVQTCDGKAVKAVHHRTSDFQSVTAGSTDQLEGSQWTINGPKKGTDVVIATVSSFANSGGAGDLTSAALYKDGVPVGGGVKYFTYNGEWDTASVQFCAKVGKGVHTLEVRVTADPSAATLLYQPSVTYEWFN